MAISKAKLTLRIALFVGTVVSLFFVPWVLVKAWLLPLPDSIPAQMQQALRLGDEHERFVGMIVYVDQAGQLPAFYAEGWQNRAQQTPANPHSLFKIASISKLYVAVAVTKLAHAKRLDLAASVGHYFPELIGKLPYAEQISIRLLLQHRSGIANFTDAPDYWSNTDQSAEQQLQLALTLPANFAPDQGHAYSNTNYLLLAMLIKQVVGYSHQQFIQEQILNPLGLTETFASLHDIDQNQLMSGYYVGVEQDIKSNDYGSMIASAQDVGKFIRALNDGSLLTPDEQTLYASLYQFGHGGLMPGYQSLAEYHADLDTVVVQFINTTDFNGYQWNLSQIIYNRIVSIIAKQRANAEKPQAQPAS